VELANGMINSIVLELNYCGLWS